ncbi:hypothetical protein Tco_0447813 [Tanacetum coccineum]
MPLAILSDSRVTTSCYSNNLTLARRAIVSCMADAKLACRVFMSSLIDSICSGGGGTTSGGGNGSGDGDTDRGGDGEGDLDLLRDEDDKSDGGGEDDDGKSDGGDDDDGISDGNSDGGNDLWFLLRRLRSDTVLEILTPSLVRYDAVARNRDAVSWHCTEFFKRLRCRVLVLSVSSLIDPKSCVFLPKAIHMLKTQKQTIKHII